MASVKVTELRQNLPAYLARVQRGERLQITSRGKVIAEIVAPMASKAEIDAARKRLRSLKIRWDNPLEPAIDPREWEMDQ